MILSKAQALQLTCF